MKSVNPVKMLSALALVLLVFGATEGRIFSKCELKKKLDAAQFQVITVMGEKISPSQLIARLVCKANSSAFNTSFVKAIMVNPAQAPAGGKPQGPAGGKPQGPSGGPTGGPPQAPGGGKPQGPAGGPTGGPPQAPAGGPPKNHTQVPTKEPIESSHEATHPQLNSTAKVSGQLYGMFQFSDQLACDSGMMPSLNICNMSCSALIDDDITNDIACLKSLIKNLKPKPNGKPTVVAKIVEELMKKECRSIVPSKYFKECV